MEEPMITTTITMEALTVTAATLEGMAKIMDSRPAVKNGDIRRMVESKIELVRQVKTEYAIRRFK